MIFNLDMIIYWIELYLCFVPSYLAPPQSQINPHKYSPKIMNTNLSFFAKLLGSLGQHFLGETVIVISIIKELDNAGSQAGGDEEGPLRAPPEGLHGAWFLLKLHNPLAL